MLVRLALALLAKLLPKAPPALLRALRALVVWKIIGVVVSRALIGTSGSIFLETSQKAKRLPKGFLPSEDTLPVTTSSPGVIDVETHLVSDVSTTPRLDFCAFLVPPVHQQQTADGVVRVASPIFSVPPAPLSHGICSPVLKGGGGIFTQMTTTFSTASFGKPTIECPAAVNGAKIAGAANALLCAVKLYSKQGAPQTIFRRDFIVSLPRRREHLLRLVDKPKATFLLNQFDCLRSPTEMDLCDGARRIMDEPNAGGSSVWSEVLSLEVLYRMFGAQLLKTEMEIRYAPAGSKKTDYSCVIGHQKLGVSVTRAYKYRGVYTNEDAALLLHKKLYGVLASSQNVVKRDRWRKQILHVWAQSVHVANIVMEEYQKMSAFLRSNTVVIITISHNAGWIFRNPTQTGPGLVCSPWV